MFPAFFATCKWNKFINWTFITDCEIPPAKPQNIQFIRMTLNEFNEYASKKLGMQIHKNFYSQLDLRPAYGELFKDMINGADYWGHCDFDTIWGDLSEFFLPKIQEGYDIISARIRMLSGHFTLYKNSVAVNNFYKNILNYAQYFENPEHVNMDEAQMSRLLKKGSELKVFWNWDKKIVGGYPELKYQPHGWIWRDGRVFNKEGEEFAYIHLIHWKKEALLTDFKTGDNPNFFRVTRKGIWCDTPNPWYSFLEKTSLDIRWRSLAKKLKIPIMKN